MGEEMISAVAVTVIMAAIFFGMSVFGLIEYIIEKSRKKKKYIKKLEAENKRLRQSMLFYTNEKEIQKTNKDREIYLELGCDKYG